MTLSWLNDPLFLKYFNSETAWIGSQQVIIQAIRPEEHTILVQRMDDGRRKWVNWQELSDQPKPLPISADQAPVRSTRQTHCWSCKTALDGSRDSTCQHCRGIRCPRCRACFCNWSRAS